MFTTFDSSLFETQMSQQSSPNTSNGIKGADINMIFNTDPTAEPIPPQPVQPAQQYQQQYQPRGYQGQYDPDSNRYSNAPINGGMYQQQPVSRNGFDVGYTTQYGYNDSYNSQVSNVNNIGYYNPSYGM